MGDNKHRPYGELPVTTTHYEEGDFNPDRRSFLQGNAAALCGLYLMGTGAYADGVGDGYRKTTDQNDGSNKVPATMKNQDTDIDPVDVVRLGGLAAVGASVAHDVLIEEVNGNRRAILKIGGAAIVDSAAHKVGKLVGENSANADVRSAHLTTPSIPTNTLQTSAPITTAPRTKGK